VAEEGRGEGNKATKEAAKQKTYHALGKHGAKNEEERKTRNKAAKDGSGKGRAKAAEEEKKGKARGIIGVGMMVQMKEGSTSLDGQL
jgi:hypothetical protein